MKNNRISSAVVCSFIVLLLVAPQSSNANSTTATIMHEVYDAIAYLLPLSLRDPAAASIWDGALIEAKVAKLNNAAQALERHMTDRESESHQISRSFKRTVADIDKSFANSWPEFAYFSMMDLVQHCTACHARTSAPSQDLFGQRLIARMDTRDMPPSDVVKLFVATRQFDAALSSLERKLMSPELHPTEADYTSDLVDYLHIAISASRKPQRAKSFLQDYSARSDLPYYLERRLDVWISAIEQYASALASPPDFDVAKAIFYEADKLSRGPSNRLRAAHDVIAASIIRAILDSKQEITDLEISEAYYILGVVALRTLEPNSAVPEMELLFSSAVKADPKSRFAEEAFALLEEYGYVHEDHLAEGDQQQTLIDMSSLRALMTP